MESPQSSRINGEFFQPMTSVPLVTAATVPPLDVLVPTMITPVSVRTTMSMMRLLDVWMMQQQRPLQLLMPHQ